MAKHNRNPKQRRSRKWGRNVGDPNNKNQTITKKK